MVTMLSWKAPLRGVSTARVPPSNFSEFCFAKCNKTCSALHLCCHLHLPRQQIIVDFWAATFGFELKNNCYYKYSVISVIIVLSNKQIGSYSKIYKNCFYVPYEERTLKNPWVKSFSCIKMASRGTSWRHSWRLLGTFLNQQLTMWKNWWSLCNH